MIDEILTTQTFHSLFRLKIQHIHDRKKDNTRPYTDCFDSIKSKEWKLRLWHLVSYFTVCIEFAIAFRLLCEI